MTVSCFRFVCTFESFCLNNCKTKRSKKRTLFEFVVYAKTKKWEGTDTVVVSGKKTKRIIIGSDRRPETKQGIEGKIVRFRSGRVRDRVRVRVRGR